MLKVTLCLMIYVYTSGCMYSQSKSECLTKVFLRKDLEARMAHNHVFSNHALHECATPLFQWEIGVRGKGFLCHYQGIVWKIRLRRLESKILSPLGPCPPPLPKQSPTPRR